MFNNKNKKNTDKKEYDEEMIMVQFIKSNEKKFIKCFFYEKVSDLIRRYRIKAEDNENANFFFSTRLLNPSLTVFESGLLNNSPIYVNTLSNISGGYCPINFTDVSKNKTKEIYFSKNAPSYRGVTKGINICGICKCKMCKACKKEVVVPIKKKKINLIKERDELFCPECESIIIPKTVCFYMCKFKIYGKKIKNGKEQYFENEPDEASNENSAKYFDPELNGEIMVSELIFEVLKYL